MSSPGPNPGQFEKKQLNPGQKRDFARAYDQFRSLPQEHLIQPQQAKDLYNYALQLVSEAQDTKDLERKQGLTLKAINILKNENIRKYIHEELLNNEQLKEALKFAEALKRNDEKAIKEHMQSFSQRSNPIVKNAMSKESYGQRIAHLAQFDQNSMAIMALVDEIIFFINFTLSITGAKLVFSQAGSFETMKRQIPQFVYDPEDYPYPSGNSKEDKATREVTEKLLAERQIYHYILLPQGGFILDKERGLITNPNQISYEVAAANGLIHKPDPILAARHDLIDFWVRMMGKSPDPLSIIAKQNENSGSPEATSSKDAEIQAQLNARMAARPPR